MTTDGRSILETIVDFLLEIGVPVVEATLPTDTFLPGVTIRRGGLAVDPHALRWPGDLLHEAGHLAVLPAAARGAAADDLAGEDVDELAAMAWAWAATLHLGLPPEVLLHEGGYQGRSQDLLTMHSVGIVPGLRGLCEMGLTSAVGFGGAPDDPQYPTMRRWLRA